MAKYWLFKSEPDAYSIDQFRKDKTTRWDGVRNYQARNFMMNDMSVGDWALFYHSNAKPPGVIGLAQISKPAAPDMTALNKKSQYFDPKASEENPRWFCVELTFKEKFNHLISLDDIRADKNLKEMLVIKKGSRLSIQPVSKKDFEYICKLGGATVY